MYLFNWLFQIDFAVGPWTNDMYRAVEMQRVKVMKCGRQDPKSLVLLLALEVNQVDLLESPDKPSEPVFQLSTSQC